jgi:hypothetical protein
MRVRIICYEDVNEWILGKFALRMREDLIKLGVDVDIAKVADSTADINHHIIYEQFNGVTSNNDTLMITHIDSSNKLNHLKKVIDNVSYGICMSKDTMTMLSSMGVSKDRLCYINPAQDGDFIPRKIQIGYTSRWYADGRKREYLLRELAKHLDNRFFAFKFMGQGWDSVVNLMKENGFQVDYFPNFDLQIYKRLMSEIDYYLYTGLDEGQMGFVDALAAGVKTIVTPQGYHLDVENGITHPFKDSTELLQIFDDIYDEKIKLIKSVEMWTWKNYTLKHLELWNHILGNDVKLIDNYQYNDGIYSLASISAEESESINVRKIKRQLYFSGLRRSIFVRYHYYTSRAFLERLKSKLSIRG